LYFPPTETERAEVFAYFWCPQDTILERDRTENIHYSEWVREGLIFAIPGNANDFRFIVEFIIQLPKEIRLKAIAYDRWNANDTVNTLMDEGIKMEPYGQGFASMSQPSKQLEQMVLRQEINHQGNPVLSWQMENVSLRYDPADNIKPDKAKSKDKIDGIVSLVMAIGQHTKDTYAPSTKSRYEDEGAEVYAI
jgi:phage terminase large subunit-like protein